MAILISCTPIDLSKVYIAQHTNATREAVQQPDLKLDARLDEVAQSRADMLASTEVLSHDSPDGCNAFCLMDKDGIPPVWAGENIGWNNWTDWPSSQTEMMQAWINSSEHYANIIDCHYTLFGVGIASSQDGKKWYVTVFWGDISSC